MKPGSYQAVVTEHRWTTAKSGLAGLAITADVTDSFGGIETVTGTIWFSPKAMHMARKQLGNLGFRHGEQKAADIGNTISFVGRNCEVQLEENEYPKGSGKKTIKIGWFGPRTYAPPPPADVLAGLDAALDDAKDDMDADEFERANPLPPPPVAPPPPPPLTEDGLPFSWIGIMIAAGLSACSAMC